MVKNKKKSSLKSKDELLKIMNDHLEQQQQFAEKLKGQALKYISIDEGDSDNDIKKKKNHYLNAYNQQVDAVSRTSATMIRIYNSSLENSDVEEESHEELID